MGSPPDATAKLTARGTSRTVAPTLDITSVKPVPKIASPTCKAQSGQPSSNVRICPAIQAAVPVFCTACPSGISDAKRNTNVDTMTVAAAAAAAAMTVVTKKSDAVVVVAKRGASENNDATRRIV